MTNTKQLLAAAKAIQADAVALGMGKPAGHDPERLRLLEAVAEAAMADARIPGLTFAKYLSRYSRYMSDNGRTLLEALAALAALEALDKKEQP